MSELYTVSGKRFSLDSLPPGWQITRRPGGWLLAEGPNGERVRFALHEAGGKLGAQIGGRLYFGEVSASRAAGAGTEASDADLTAQFPGKVRKVLVTEKQAVKAGEALILVEAMKMEFTIRAPYGGQVANVRVKDGQPISPGDRFLDVTRDVKKGSDG